MKGDQETGHPKEAPAEEASAEHRSRASFHELLDFLVETVGERHAILAPVSSRHISGLLRKNPIVLIQPERQMLPANAEIASSTRGCFSIIFSIFWLP
jgi:hypothetical protein